MDGFRAPRVADLIARATHDQPYYTFEFFPPRTDQGVTNLHGQIARMVELQPSCVHVTWGPGGVTAATSVALAVAVQREHAIPACLHITCTNMSQATLDETLGRAHANGIRNILALRGDAPRSDEYWVATDARFQHAADLVTYVRDRYGDYFCIGVAGYPEGPPDGTSADDDMAYLGHKIAAGADYIVSQLFYTVDCFNTWKRACRTAGIRVPIVPGVMPIHSYGMWRRIVKLVGTAVPAEVSQAVDPIHNDDSAVRAYGIKYATTMIRELVADGTHAFHLCTMNLEDPVKQVTGALGWSSEKKIPTSLPGWILQAKPPGALEDFPNGRFGDARSPAFGEQGAYGSVLDISPEDAQRLWKAPVDENSVTSIFLRHLHGEIQRTPWSTEPLHSETTSILRYLESLCQSKLWTVGSQPAVDGVRSSDEVFGFGPRGGWIYQKAFVEFFATEADATSIEAAILSANQSNGVNLIHFFSATARGETRTNVPDTDSVAVTWGAFPGREIVTPTQIDAIGFDAWRQEAFQIWEEWAMLYGSLTVTRRELKRISANLRLVAVVHDDFKRTEALWHFLTAEK